jgi:hypothetical protein
MRECFSGLDSDSAACPAWSRHTTVKNDASCFRRPGPGDPERRPGDAAVGVPQLGVVGEVAGEADLCGWHAAALLVPCPWNRARWTSGQAARPPGASRGANERGLAGSGCRPPVGSGAELVRGRACGWGRACHHRSARSLPSWARWRTRLPPRGPLAGLSQASASGVTWQLRTQEPERAEVTAYQDDVWLGRAIVAVDAIAPGEAPPEGTKARGVFLGQAG